MNKKAPPYLHAANALDLLRPSRHVWPLLAGTSDSPTHTGDCDSSVPQRSSMTSAIAPPPFLHTPGTPRVPWPKWRLFFTHTLTSPPGTPSCPLTRSLLLNALGVEGLAVYWTLHRTRRRRDEGTRDEYIAALTLLENHFKAPSNEVLERHYFNMRKQILGESVPNFLLYRQ
ncbi:hypothetical protein MRX96_005169 [Rhipicephalus microplus]